MAKGKAFIAVRGLAQPTRAVDKPAGLLSEPTRVPGAANLLGLVTARFGPLTLFHRLVRDTSGVVLLTRGGPINRYLDAAFKAGAV